MMLRLARWIGIRPKRRLPCRLASLAAVSLTLLLSGNLSSARAQDETLWQIGTFNESSSDLAPVVDPATGQPRIDYSNPAQDPVYIVGKSDPARDWFAFQPGTANGRAGHRPHPFTILFDLAESPEGSYKLRVSLLAYAPRLPKLQVELNGHRGWFYQHPRLSYNAGDPWIFYLPHYSTTQIECDLPLRYLVKGRNRLVLTALDDVDQRDDSQPLGFPWPGTSGLIYDALALETRNQPSAQRVAATAVPTIYYRSRGSQLVERVDLFVRLNERPRRGEVRLTVGGNRFVQPLVADRDFGEMRLEFEVPEFIEQKSEIRVSLNGRTSRSVVKLTPARKWTLFVVPNEHLDIGYTDYASKVAEIHSRSIDEAMALIEQYPEFRFTLDGSWIVEQFLKGRTKEQQARFFRMVAEKKIFVPANHGSHFTGFAGLENLIRSLYYSRRLSERHGGSFDMALINDVPSYSWSYASVLAAAGLKYFLAAVDVYRAPFLLFNRFHERSPQYWEGPDGGKILTWYSRHYHQMGSLFGMPPRVENGREALPRFLKIYDQPEYRASATILFGSQVENVGLFPEQASLARDWNQLYAFPKLQYSGIAEAMSSIAGQFGNLPQARGDGGPYWEDGLGANALITALSRENMQRVLSAEKLSTISSLVNPAVRPDREVLKSLWRELMVIDEHSWQADRSVTDPESHQSIRQGEVKDGRALLAKWSIDHTLGRAMAAISHAIDSPKGTLVVFNPLSWRRDGLIEVDIDKGLVPLDQATQEPVPHEVVASGRSFHRLRFVARDVPEVGYKCFALKPDSAVAAVRDAISGTALESPFYRLILDPETGAVRSILDKELNRELVDATSPYRFNQHLYVTGADALPNRLAQYSTVSPVPELKIHPSQSGRIVSVRKFPFGAVARLQSSNVNTPRIETEIVLFSGQKRIEFINRVSKQKVYTKEGVYFAFPFSMEAPRFRYATQNGYVDPARDLLPGAGREWFTVQHWVSVEERGLSAALVPVDAPLVTLGDIARGTWPTEFGQRKGTVFSYVMNNYTPEGYLAGQGGEFTFRYVLASSEKFDPTALSRLGWEAMSPLEVNEIRPNDKPVPVRGSLDAVQKSFLQINRSNVVLLTWKLAEDGKGSILRFLEVGGKSATVTVTLSGVNIEQAWLCNAVEDNLRSLSTTRASVSFAVKPFEIVTIRLSTSSASGP